MLVIVPLWLLLFVAAYGLLLAVRTMRPRVSSSASWQGDEDSGAWVVAVRNVGRAPVELLDVAYDVETRDDATPVRLEAVPWGRVVAALRDAGYAVERDDVLPDLSIGSWYSSGAEARVAALPAPFARRFRTFRARCTWRSDGGLTGPPAIVDLLRQADG